MNNAQQMEKILGTTAELLIGFYRSFTQLLPHKRY